MSTTRSATHRPGVGKRRYLATVVVATLAAGLVATTSVDATAATAPGGPTGVPGATSAEPLAFRVDPGLAAPRLSLDPVGRLGTGREVGVVAGPDGKPAGLVLDEVMVRVADQAELDAFLARWGGQVLDSFAPDAQGQDHLVRVDADRADPAGLVGNLLAAEPRQSGGFWVGDERALRLLALAAAEWRTGTELVLDWLVEPSGITDGQVFEAPDIGKNVFDWTFMRAGGALDIGVAPAWQLLESKGKLTKQVKYLVQDGGFQSNADFPSKVSGTRRSGVRPTPTTARRLGLPVAHATDVVLAGMGRVDNDYGTAGPAGPVVQELVGVRRHRATGRSCGGWRRPPRRPTRTWSTSASAGTSNLGGNHARTWTDRRMKHVRDTGALIVAAAGNNGTNVDGDTLWVPCESTHVMCVGGMNTNATVAGGSNWGTKNLTTSVEILRPDVCGGPDRSGHACGQHHEDHLRTSVASPFVGGSPPW